MGSTFRSGILAVLLASTMATGVAFVATVSQAAEVAGPVSEAEAYSIGREGYDFLFPLVTMDLTRRAQMTAASAAEKPRVAGANTFWHWPAFPPGEFRAVVRPNFDTLYSMAWVDVSKGPVTLTIKPGMDRYYLLPLMDMWTDVYAVPGTRTMGQAGAKFLFVSRDWKGKAPADTEVIRAPTTLSWLLARIQTNGPKDYAHIHELQQAITLTPSVPNRGGPEIDAALDRKTPPARIMGGMGADQFFAEAARLTGLYAAHDVDQPVLARLGRIGFRPGQPFDLTRQPPAVQSALKRAVADGIATLRGSGQSSGQRRGTWTYQSGNLGAYGGDYRTRAAVALGGLGANRIEDAIYPATAMDADGKPLTGATRYVMHFDKGATPPAGAFWSLTAYDVEGFPIQTPERRYAVGDRDPLVYNTDGSLDLYIGATAPADPSRKANWLPTLADPFTLTMRIYLPRAEVLDGRWSAPPVTPVRP